MLQKKGGIAGDFAINSENNNKNPSQPTRKQQCGWQNQKAPPNEPKDAYTIMRLMVKIYGIDKDKLNGPFSTWPEGAPTLYTRIRLTLEKLKAQGLVDSKKRGKAQFYFWKT